MRVISFQLGRAIPDPLAHDDRRGRGFGEISVNDILASRSPDRLGDDREALLGRNQADRNLKLPRLVLDPGFDRMVVEQRQDLVGVAGPRQPGIEDERFSGEFLQRDRGGFLGEVVGGGKSDDQRFVSKHRSPNRRILEADPAEADVDAAVLQGDDLVERDALHESEVDVRRLQTELADQFGQARVDRRGDEADREASPLRRDRRPDHRTHVLDTGQHLQGLLMEEVTDRRQLQGPFASIDERCAQLGFELLDRAAERGLGDMKPVRSAVDVPFGCDGNEIAELAKVHFNT